MEAPRASRPAGWTAGAKPTPSTELRALLRITAPLAAAYLAEMAMSFTDMAIVGRLGSVELAAVGLAANLLVSVLFICMGVVSIVGVLVAQAHGAGDDAAAGRGLRQGLWVATALSVPQMALGWYMAPLLRLTGQEEAVVLLAEQYLRGLIWCILPYMWFTVLRNFVSALARPGAIMVITVAAVGLNLAACYTLVFGKFGFPALGVAGAGYGTALVSWVMFAALALHVVRAPGFRAYRPFGALGRLDPPLLRQILRLGTPVAGLMAVEAGLFSAVAVLMGLFGATALAAHQVAASFASLVFMVPMALGQAATIRVAHGLGRGSVAAARQAGRLGIVAVALFMAVMAVVMWTAPEAIVSLFLDTADPENAKVLALAAVLLGIAAVFQIVDGVQVIAAGALRGLKDTTAPLLVGLLGYWGVGLTAGWLLAFPFGLAGPGLWLGVAFGLAVAAVLLSWRFHARTGALLRADRR
ncbi:MAG TPA: MATE family efflux transporter [Dongiaceae bacterium]|nr:MATE family efflux transporter [Dongiaceae bacterium]